MNENSESPGSQNTSVTDVFSDSLTTGVTVLVATIGDPSDHALGLRALSQYGTAEDTALVVTTGESSEQIIEGYDRLCSTSDRPSLGLVDTVSTHQSVSAVFNETPVVFTPSPSDLERLVMALSELSGPDPPQSGARHLVIRSLTPVLETAQIDKVCRVLERITGLRSETGFCLIGLDYAAHDEEVVSAISKYVDGILWVTQKSADTVEAEYQPSRGRYDRVIGGFDGG